MNINPRILFFGSNEDSVTVLNALFEAKFNIVAVVTQPPKPIGRKKIITPTPTENWAVAHKITVVHFKANPEKPWAYEDEASVVNTLSTFSPDLLISASYGLKIPTETINSAKYGGLNVHPSLLPRFRGADPIPWTIISGDAQAGVTIVTLTEKMDQGKIIAQQKIAVDQKTTHIPLRTELFKLGSQLLLSSLEDYLDGTNKGNIQNQLEACTARRMIKLDGFVPRDFVLAAIGGKEIDFDLYQPVIYNTIFQLTTHY